MKKVLIYGTGDIAVLEQKRCLSCNVELAGFVETHKTKDVFLNLPVYNADEIPKLIFDEIHIANSHIETIDTCLQLGIDEGKIVVCSPEVKGDHHLFLEYLKRNNYQCNIKFSGGLVVTRIMSFRSLPFYTEKMDMAGNHLYFNDDYSRYGTLALLADEIEENDVPGDVAELGVYQGKFASIIHQTFPERTLHLFDTFEGFAAADISPEEISDVGARAGQFCETSVETVIKKMNGNGKIELHKGYFPSTIPDKEIVYSFVSIDCDLYAPAKAGLEYFYPRLSQGGYIMLHDYNGFFGNGISKAVRDYEALNGHLCKVPLPDEAGTIVLAK